MALTVFLVDDNVTFLAAARGFLGGVAHLVVAGCALTGHQALRQIDEVMPDVVLLDIALPDINGLELGRILRAKLPPPQVIFMSMDDVEPCRAMAQEMGALGVVHKSEFVRELVPLLESLVRTTVGGASSL
jgi:DNA-binding NarL/FixJ family response regulator